MKRCAWDRTAAVVVLSVCATVVAGLSSRDALALYHGSATGLRQISGLEKASRLSSSDWRYPFQLARLAAAVGRHEMALEHYAEALERFPGCASCWVGCAESELALGRDPAGSLERAIRYGRSMTSVRTRAAVVYAKLDQHGEAAREFSAALGGHRFDKPDFYALMNRLYDPSFVLSSVIRDEDLDSYFRFARSALPTDDVARVWARFVEHPQSHDQRDLYAKYLIENGELHAAWSVSNGGTTDMPSGQEEMSFQRAGHDEAPFGWTIVDKEGVRAGVIWCGDCEPPSYALRVRFDGDHNPGYFGVSRYVALEPNRTYTLAARIKHTGITSTEGPRLVVRGVSPESHANCGLVLDGERVRGTSGWHDSSLTFHLPPGCQGVRLAVARAEARSLDRYIDGDYWLGGVTLRPSAATVEKALQQGRSLAAGALAG